MKLLKILLVVLFLSLILLRLYKSNQPSIETKIQNTNNSLSQIKEEYLPQPTKMLETGLPDKHQIKTAFIEQAPLHDWSQPWQDACEEAALLTVDYFYKNSTPTPEIIKDSILKMIDYEHQKGWSKDINITQMSQLAEEYLNYSTRIIENPTIENIKKYISQDIPVIITANGKTLFLENSNFRSGGPYYHSLAILGYDDTQSQFVVHDVGTRHGKYFRYSYDLLMKSIHDFPESGRKEDIENGNKKVLVLLK